MHYDCRECGESVYYKDSCDQPKCWSGAMLRHRMKNPHELTEVQRKNLTIFILENAR